MSTTAVIAPRQARAKATEERIVAAALGLLSERALTDISVSEIAARAGVSIGGFYSRFGSKSALLHWLDQVVLQPEMDRVLTQLEAQNSTSLPLLIRRYLELCLAALTRHRSILRQVVLASRSSSGGELRDQIRRFNEALDGRVVDLLLSASPEIRHTDRAFAIRFGLAAASSTLREAVLFGEYELDGVVLGEERLVDELSRMLLAYLTNLPVGEVEDEE